MGLDPPRVEHDDTLLCLAYDPEGELGGLLHFVRLFGRLLVRADAFFQIERLYRFNEKFNPRWEARYLMYDGALNLPRTALAALWIEGQLPRPRIRRSATVRR